jgi:hypothetical protein
MLVIWNTGREPDLMSEDLVELSLPLIKIEKAK